MNGVTGNPDRAPHQLPLCDMVMEGGVTSGVVYPKAAVLLSRRFRLKNIGGTSVGALAAALTAAAEVGRARNPDANPGYTRLSKLPEQLQGPGFSRPGVSRLFDLFQPQPALRPLFDILASSLNRDGVTGRLLHVLLAVVRNFFSYFAVVTVAVAMVFWVGGARDPAGWAAAVLFGGVCGVGASCYALYQRLTGALVENGFGICSGYIEGSDATLAACDRREPLTLWLARLINECAGKAADEAPLRFGELWNPTGDLRSEPPDWMQKAGFSTWRYIDLQVISTNVTHGRPYRFPNEDSDQKLFFKPSELTKLFPKNVVDHMVAHAQPYAPGEGKVFPAALPEGLLMLPEAADLPVVFAARLSLSFPFLLSAVPLYAVDFEQRDFALRTFERCWFSDGGICSNFPIHFFDAAVPLWPTFGMKLEAERKFKPIGDTPDTIDNRWFLPERNGDGRGDAFFRFDEEAKGVDRLSGFIGAILDSARHWQNHMLVRAPGVRDRVLRLFLRKSEGGLNLNMSAPILAGLTEAGEKGADKLAQRFQPGSSDPMNFDNHRWIRMRSLTAVLEKDLADVHKALEADAPASSQWDTLLQLSTLAEGADKVALRDRFHVDVDQAPKMAAMIEQLRELSVKADKTATAAADLLSANAPRRATVIRVVPDI